MQPDLDPGCLQPCLKKHFSVHPRSHRSHDMLLHVLILWVSYLSVRLSITLMDCDHIVQKSGHDSVDQCLCYLNVEDNPEIVISCDPEFDGRWWGKCGVLHFGNNRLANSISCILDQIRTLVGNCIRQIKWYRLLALSTTRGAWNYVRNPSNLAVYGCKQYGCHSYHRIE